jgi:CheY-like chemotaxis protein
MAVLPQTQRGRPAGDASQLLGRQLPYLRRYARAITGNQAVGDQAVRHCLERLLSIGVPEDLEDIRLTLFRTLHDVWQDDEPAQPVAVPGEKVVEQRLDSLSPLERQALVLIALEGFTPHDVAYVLRLPGESEALQLFQTAKVDLRRQAATRILIIEDEPMIALDIASTVEQRGHTVVGIAATRDEAVELAAAKHPGLILADIQLADDSSGIDAVNDILANGAVPIIFITAFPERLLTGEKPEPTFLITKPFDSETLDVTISQALAAHRPLARIGRA